jgi:hypothetical protein
MTIATGETILAADVNAIKAIADAAGKLVIAESGVFDGNSPASSAWTDLDLSGVIGSNAALVLLKIKLISTATWTVAFRKNGDTNEYFRDGEDAGVALFTVANDIEVAVIVPTDGSGIIEWRADQTSAALRIGILAYIVEGS